MQARKGHGTISVTAVILIDNLERDLKMQCSAKRRWYSECFVKLTRIPLLVPEGAHL